MGCNLVKSVSGERVGGWGIHTGRCKGWSEAWGSIEKKEQVWAKNWTNWQFFSRGSFGMTLVYTAK